MHISWITNANRQNKMGHPQCCLPNAQCTKAYTIILIREPKFHNAQCWTLLYDPTVSLVLVFFSFFLFFFKIYRHVMDLCVNMFILLWISCITVKPLCCQIYNKHCQSRLDNLQVLTLNNKIESIPPQTTRLTNYHNWINTSNKISFMLNSVYPLICPSPFKCWPNSQLTVIAVICNGSEVYTNNDSLCVSMYHLCWQVVWQTAQLWSLFHLPKIYFLPLLLRKLRNKYYFLQMHYIEHVECVQR